MPQTAHCEDVEAILCCCCWIKILRGKRKYAIESSVTREQECAHTQTRHIYRKVKTQTNQTKENTEEEKKKIMLLTVCLISLLFPLPIFATIPIGNRTERTVSNICCNHTYKLHLIYWTIRSSAVWFLFVSCVNVGIMSGGDKYWFGTICPSSSTLIWAIWKNLLKCKLRRWLFLYSSSFFIK